MKATTQLLEKEFLEVLEGMIANDKEKREENFDKLKTLLKEKFCTKSDTNQFNIYFPKIWKTFFYCII